MKEKKKIFKESNGQSLIEVSVALTILITSIVSMMMVVTAMKNLSYDSSDRNKANSLAQEGIEMIKNQRNIGCSFNDLVMNFQGNANDFYVIYKDIDSNQNNDFKHSTDSALPNSLVFNISDFVGYERRFYIYDVNNLPHNPGDPFKSVVDAFPDPADNDFDNPDNYIYVRVEIQWTDRYDNIQNYQLSTIMRKSQD